MQQFKVLQRLTGVNTVSCRGDDLLEILPAFIHGEGFRQKGNADMAVHDRPELHFRRFPHRCRHLLEIDDRGQTAAVGPAQTVDQDGLRASFRISTSAIALSEGRVPASRHREIHMGDAELGGGLHLVLVPLRDEAPRRLTMVLMP